MEDSLCTAGRVSEASRHAVMAFGISAAAAGSGAVPNLHVGMHAAASSAAAAAVARGKGIKGSSKSMKLAEAAAQAAATAAVAAVQKAEASAQRSALPPYADLQSVQQLWKLWKKGSHSSPAWEQHEEQGKAWHRGERQRWHELLQRCSGRWKLWPATRASPQSRLQPSWTPSAGPARCPSSSRGSCHANSQPARLCSRQQHRQQMHKPQQLLQQQPARLRQLHTKQQLLLTLLRNRQQQLWHPVCIEGGLEGGLESLAGV